MNAAPAPQTITPERQAAAAQVAAVFNSLHAYVTTLQTKNEEGVPLTTQPLEYVRKSIEEASFWAVKHVLQFGVPPVPVAAPADPTPPPPTAANDTADTGTGTDVVADPAAPPTDSIDSPQPDLSEPPIPTDAPAPSTAD